MNREIELQLIDRCIQKYTGKTTTLGESESKSDALRYISDSQFEQELNALFRQLPIPHAHCSELPKPNSYKKVATSLGELLLTRDEQNRVHAFHNICRHRGTALVADEAGCTKRFTCPYHAWSYKTDGELAGVPGEDLCFPQLDKTQNKLLELPTVEKYGFVWVCPVADSVPDVESHLDDYLGAMGASLAWLQLEGLHVFKSDTRVWDCNWKILAEGGLETYHFSFAHRNTIAPHFLNNTAVIDQFDGHFRMVMPTKRIEEVARQPAEQRSIRECTHTVFALMPVSSLLMQKEHVDWIQFRPLSPRQTEVTITNLVPDNVKALSEQQKLHWQKNVAITRATLEEDFVMGEGIQKALNSGALSKINYGRNEWALKALNEQIDILCGPPIRK